MQANQYNVVQTPRKVAHWLHFVLSIITFGIWIPVWITVVIYTAMMNAKAGSTRILTTTAYPYPSQVSATPISQDPTALPPPAPSSQTPQMTPGSSQTPSGLWVPAHSSNRPPSIPSASDTANPSFNPQVDAQEQSQKRPRSKNRGPLVALALIVGLVGLGVFASIVAANALPPETAATNAATDTTGPRSTPTTTTPRTTTTTAPRATTTIQPMQAVPYVEDGVIHYQYETSLGNDAISDVIDTTNCDDFWFDVNWFVTYTEILATPDAKMFADVMLIRAEQLGCDAYQLPEGW